MYVVSFKPKTPYTDRIICNNEAGRNVNVSISVMRKYSFDVTFDPILESCKLFEVQTEQEAEALGYYLATVSPGSEVAVSKTVAVFQSDKPNIKKKSVSDKGILPV